MPSVRDQWLTLLRDTAAELAATWAQTERIFGLARHLARQEEADRFLVGAAVLLRALDAATQGSLLVTPDLPAPTVTALRALVTEVAQPLGLGASLEWRVIHDARTLDQLGAGGIMAALNAAPHEGRGWYDRRDPFALLRDLAPTVYPLDLLYERLTTLPQAMQTPTGRTLALQRSAIVLFFFEALRAEFTLSLPDAFLPSADWLVPEED